MKKLLLLAAALVAAVTVLAVLTVPPHRQALPIFADGTVPGIIHVHTNRSDGLSAPDQVAAAAARAGLKFLIFTDHGDATRAPAPPVYRSGVLCLDGVEISTNGGHYVAIDMPASPYPLGGEARDVVDDVRRLGGFGIAAHPDSPKPQLQWREWDAPFDAIELLNPDTSWRIVAEQTGWSPRWRLIKALVDYPVRPAEVMASMIQPTRALANWAAIADTRRVIAIAGADAHSKLALRSADPGDSRPSTGSGRPEPDEGRYALPFPSYETSFGVLSIRVRPDSPFTGDAATDARLLMRAIRAGHLHTVVDGLATPAAFELSATNEHGTVHEGDAITAADPVILHVRTNAPADFTTVIHEGTRTLAAQRGAEDWTVHGSNRPAIFWVEILPPGPQPVTWLRSNPVYVRAAAAPDAPRARAAATASRPLFEGPPAPGWSAEHDPTSLAAVDLAPIVGGNELRLRFGLSGGSPIGKVAALTCETAGGVASSTRLRFTLRAERPMRVSVQLRGGDGVEDRWQRTVYVDLSNQEHTIDFDDFTPVGVTHTARPPLGSIRHILFVIDGTNTKPGTSGRIWIRNAVLETAVK